MKTKYNKSEKIWAASESDITFNCGLGEAIFAKLEKDDEERVLEVFYDNGSQRTVGDIRRLTIIVAQNLQRLGMQKGDKVVLYSLSNEYITPITFACYTIGAPVNFFETNFEGSDIDYVLQQIDPTLIIFQEEFRSKLFSSLERINPPNLKYLLTLGTMAPSVDKELFSNFRKNESFQVPDIGDPTTHPAALMFTSGTTGLPKIIMLSHAVLLQGTTTCWKSEPGSKVLSFSPLRWISQVSKMLQSVFLGIERIYTSQKLSGTLFRDIIDTWKITDLATAPTMYRAILAAAESSGDASSLSSLKVALVVGEVISDQLIDHFAKAIPNCKIVKSYGMTELGGLISSVEESSKKVFRNGGLSKGFMVKIIDHDNNLLGPNEMGQLLVKSTLRFLGYLKNDNANKESFLEDGWFNTGDYGYMDSNNIPNIVTRYKYLIQSRGKIVIPTNIEDVVNSHPSVLTSALVGHQNPEDPSDEIGTVFVVLRNGVTSKNIGAELNDLIRSKCTNEEVRAVRNIEVIHKMPEMTSCPKINRTLLKRMASKIQ